MSESSTREGHTDSNKLQALIDELQSGDINHRRGAAYRLGKTRDATAVAPLQKAFDEPDDLLRRNVIDALHSIGSPDALEFIASHPLPASPAAQSNITFGGVMAAIGVLCLLWFAFVISIVALRVLPGFFATAFPLLNGKLILGFIAVFMVSVLNYVLGSVFRVWNPAYRQAETAWECLLRTWGAAISAVVVVLLVVSNQPSGLSLLGVHLGSETNINAGLLGWFAVSVLVIAWGYIQRAILRVRKKQPNTSVDLSKPHISAMLVFQTWGQRLARLSETAIGVIAEDLVFRGYLVLFMGHLTGSYLPWAILSVALSVVIHLYQGTNREIVIFQLLAASFFVGLAVVTQNLFAPITAHLYYDLMAMTGIWRSADRQQGRSTLRLGLGERLAYGAFIAVNLLLLTAFAAWLLGLPA